MYIKTCVLLLVLCSLCVNIDAIRRGSFGKRIPKTSKARGGGGGGGGGSNTKDTTSEPETESKLSESFDHDFKCQGIEMKLSETQINIIKECADGVGAASKKDLTVEKVPCFAKCILEKKKLVDEEGKPHKENIQAYFAASMPEAVKEPLNAASNKCIDTHGPMVDSKDDSCHTYTPLALCMHLALVDICKIPDSGM